MQTKLLSLLPDLVQHIILEYMDYKLRRGKYIKQLPRDLPIYKYILNRPAVKEEYYTWDDFIESEFVFEYEDDDGYPHYCDEDGNDTYCMISLVTNIFKRKYWTERTIDISYSFCDRNTFKVEQNTYDYDFDGSRHRIE